MKRRHLLGMSGVALASLAGNQAAGQSTGAKKTVLVMGGVRPASPAPTN